ncbi:hypothetical protein [Ruegeria lacuscaerulensis]|uniref:hypothetical protein n=1 Tax=Ruegeria lacuscaerulensis TaxID=55218 RepID=UPI00147C778E|nr:hypothetical protein [Ruegeria lacuscaerulensis]
MEAILALLFCVFFLWVIWELFALVGDMAERRGQDRLLWQVTAIFINPFGAIILLWLFVSVQENR